ncbi:MAG: hypothetical protein HYT78_10165 [Deltaproteobacteria bacterium]|nr:hypothetical protein [Deltaproteobacteria bacterium]
MKTPDPLLVLQAALKDMEKTAAWLRQSWDRCRLIPAAEAGSEANAEAVEAFMSRFARTVDLVTNKVLRALDLVELEPSGSLLDVLHRAERRGVAASAERFREMKNLRNLIAHDYAGQYLAETFQACVEFTSELLELIERVRVYCERFSDKATQDT